MAKGRLRPANLSYIQVERAIRYLKARVADLESFPVQSINSGSDPAVAALEAVIEHNLATVFGLDSSSYSRLILAASLDTTDYDDRPDLPEIREGIARGIQRSLMLLMNEIQMLEERLEIERNGGGGPLSDFALVPPSKQPAGSVMLTCRAGEERVEVSIPRPDLDEVARRRTWGPLDPGSQNFLVEKNLKTLIPIIQMRYHPRESAVHTSLLTRAVTPLIELTLADIHQGITLPGVIRAAPRQVSHDKEEGLDAFAHWAEQLPAVPTQGPGPHFDLTAEGVIDFSPAEKLDREGNHVSRLRALHPSLRELARHLAETLGSGNAPHAALARRVSEYRKRIDQPLEVVNFSLLYIEGVRLANAEKTASEEIIKGDLPPLGEVEHEEIQSLLEIHGTFILATRAGAEMIAAEERYQRRPREEKEYRAAAIDFAQRLQNQPAVIAPEAAATILGAVEQIGQGTNPERGGTVGTSMVHNVAVVLVASAFVGSLPIAGGLMFGLYGAAAGTALGGLFGYEPIKRSKAFATVIGPLVAKLDAAADLSKMKGFLLSIEQPVRRLAAKNRRFRWLEIALGWVEKSPQSVSLPSARVRKSRAEIEVMMPDEARRTAQCAHLDVVRVKPGVGADAWEVEAWGSRRQGVPFEAELACEQTLKAIALRLNERYSLEGS